MVVDVRLYSVAAVVGVSLPGQLFHLFGLLVGYSSLPLQPSDCPVHLQKQRNISVIDESA